MAEIVGKEMEEMIPELELMEKLGIFDVNEKRVILKRRTNHEYKLQRHSKAKDDLMRYISYEMDLMKLIRKRIHEKGLQKKKNNLEVNIVNRIHKLFKISIHRFPHDLKLWITYMKFLKQRKEKIRLIELFEKLISAHSDKPKIFKLVIQWAFKELNSIQKARCFLYQGLSLHKDSKELYLQGFHLELAYSDKYLQEISENKDDIDTSASQVDPQSNLSSPSGELAEIIYDSATKKINDASFTIDFLNIAYKFSFTSSLQDRILNELKTKFSNEEITWDTLARRALEIPGTERECIEKCISVYENGLVAVPTRRMWSMYIDYTIELNEDLGNLPTFKMNCLKTALEAGQDKNMLSEKHYIAWIMKVKECDPNDVLKLATERLCTSSNLWSLRLKTHICNGDEEGTLAVFKEIISNPNIPDQANLWKIVLKSNQITDNSKTEQLWKNAINNPIVGASLKGPYIEWLAVTRGIMAARKAYSQHANSPPFTLALHTTMLKLEDAQPKLSLKSMRRVYENAVYQLGESNTDIWMMYIKFELNYGDPLNAPKIYDRAVKNLKDHLTDLFISDYHLNKAETLDTNSYSEQEPSSTQPEKSIDFSSRSPSPMDTELFEYDN